MTSEPKTLTLPATAYAASRTALGYERTHWGDLDVRARAHWEAVADAVAAAATADLRREYDELRRLLRAVIDDVTGLSPQEFAIPQSTINQLADWLADHPRPEEATDAE